MYHVLCWFIILFRLLSVILTFSSESKGHNSVTVQNRTHVYMNFFDQKDLGNHLLQLCPKVVKHRVYLWYYENMHYKNRRDESVGPSPFYKHCRRYSDITTSSPGLGASEVFVITQKFFTRDFVRIIWNGWSTITANYLSGSVWRRG